MRIRIAAFVSVAAAAAAIVVGLAGSPASATAGGNTSYTAPTHTPPKIGRIM